MGNGVWHGRSGWMRPPNIHQHAKPPPPTKNGVGPSCVVLPPNDNGQWPTILDFLVVRFASLTRAQIEARLVNGDISNDLGQPISPATPYLGQQKLYYYRTVLNEPSIPFTEQILFEDELLLAVDKPHFLPIAPAGRFVQETVLVRLKNKLGIDTIAPMHRIDRETAGVVLFTKRPETRGAYQMLFQNRQVDKQYLAVAPWRENLQFPKIIRSRIVESAHFMSMMECDGEPNAETNIELLAHGSKYGWYRLTPLTGRKHQLRVQMAGLGLPILNDQIYPEHLERNDQDLTKPLQLLAQAISFTDPISGERRTFQSQRTLLAIDQ